jgi:hypothetical protein
MPATSAVVGSGRYGVLVWQGSAGDAPTELHVPADMNAVAVSDLATSRSGDRLLLPATPGLHYLLVTEGSPTADQLAAARAELARWAPSAAAGNA